MFMIHGKKITRIQGESDIFKSRVAIIDLTLVKKGWLYSDSNHCVPYLLLYALSCQERIEKLERAATRPSMKVRSLDAATIVSGLFSQPDR